MRALDLNGCSDCKTTGESAGAGVGCSQGALCKAMAEASSARSCCDDGKGGGHGNKAGGQSGRGGGRRFRWRHRQQVAGHSPTEPGPVTLDRIRPGGVGAIREVNGVGVLRRRLLEMGVLPGTKFKVERVAPLGDPIEIRVRGYALSLRRNEAAHILVESDN